MIIPIQIQGQPAIQQKPKTPRPRMLPFQFPSMAALPMPPMSMPVMPATSMDPFDMRMPSATDMMAQMQIFQLNEPGHEQTVEVSELDDQDFFVPLRHIE